MEAPRAGAVGLVVGTVRIVVLALVIFGGLGVHLLLRLVERPFCESSRPVTPYVTQGVCRAALVILGVRLVQRGRPSGTGAAVANHISWLDIFVLNACDRVYFVAKAEAAGWPGIGLLARATGTLFIARKSREADVQRRLVEARTLAGHRLLFFPEGTSTDGARVLPFKSTLFAAFRASGTTVQPVSLRYRAPGGEDPRFYGWWGDMALGPHLWRVASKWRRGQVTVIWHAPVFAADATDRKDLARQCEERVRSGHRSGG